MKKEEEIQTADQFIPGQQKNPKPAGKVRDRSAMKKLSAEEEQGRPEENAKHSAGDGKFLQE